MRGIAVAIAMALMGMLPVSSALARQANPEANGCGTSGAQTQFAYGTAIAHQDCRLAAEKTKQDYVAVNVRWLQGGTGIDPAAAVLRRSGEQLTGRKAWKEIIKALRRATLYQVDETGVATLRVFRVKSSASAASSAPQYWAKCGNSGNSYDKANYDLVLVRPLNAWSITETSGYKVESVSSGLSGRQGLIFLTNEGHQFEIELCISHTREIQPKVLSTLRGIVNISTTFGRNDALISDAVLSEIGSVERQIAAAAGFEKGSASVWQVGWRAGEVQKVDVGLSLPWQSVPGASATGNPGVLSIQSERLATIFPGDHILRDGAVEFAFTGGRSTVLKQPISDLSVEQALDAQFLATLGDETVSPSIWENACQILERKLGQSPLRDLNSGDVLAVVWAGFASRDPIRSPAIRTSACTQRLALNDSRLAAFKRAGLEVPNATTLPSAGPYRVVFERSKEVATNAAAAANAARTIARDQVPVALLNQARVTRDALGGQFVGSLPASGEGGVGKITYSAPGFEGATWEGTVSVKNGMVVAEGSGIYTFPGSSALASGCAGGRRPTFVGLASSNELKLGILIFCDGAIFQGEMRSDAPSFGRLSERRSDDSRIQYGYFSGRSFGDGSEGVEEIWKERNGVANLQSVKTGLWVNGHWQPGL